MYKDEERNELRNKNKQTRSKDEIQLPSIKKISSTYAYFGSILRQLHECDAVIIRIHFCSHLYSNQI
jgi:hypothetical protein